MQNLASLDLGIFSVWEYENEAGDGAKDSGDEQTYVVWNRAFPAVPFARSTSATGVTTIDTGGLKLVYSGRVVVLLPRAVFQSRSRGLGTVSAGRFR